MKQQIVDLLTQALNTLKAQAVLPEDLQSRVMVENTRDKAHGNFASNIAMVVCKAAKKSPRDLAPIIIEAIPENSLIVKTEIAGPGFINFFVAADSQNVVVSEILTQGDKFGQNNNGEGKKVQIEFVSANPTGPLHIGHGRGAALGDCISRLLESTGWDVTREFYYNDAGQQINNLALSVQARCKNLGPDDASWPENGYRGDYIIDVANSYMAGDEVEADGKKHVGAKDADDREAISRFAVAYLRREQDLDLQAFKVGFDVYFLESSLYSNGNVEETVQNIISKGHTYEKDGALWLRTTDFGDDKDRVMRKSDGGYTYFVPDVAYHLNKWQRGFSTVINEQGADHHSTITRVRAGLQALDIGIPKGWPDYVLHQMVTVMRGGEEVKISKRAGSYVTLRDLIEEVGCDATRYFLAARRADSQLTFDIDLARSQSNENPVYYIQYAHARVCSIFRKLENESLSWDKENGLSQLSLLTEESEKDLISKLGRYPEVLANASKAFEPHQIATYLKELASDYHSYYNAHKMIIEDANLRDARITLSEAARQVIQNGMAILGVSTPQEM